ncbi:MAG: flagellar hook-length control protein FliK [Fimbriimonadales bacterium]
MVGPSVPVAGATVDAFLGDTPSHTAPSSETEAFAGVLEAMLLSAPSPDTDLPAPAPEALLAQANALGLTVLPLLALQTPITETLQGMHAPSASLPTIEASGTVLPETQHLPEPTPIIGDGMGDTDFTETLDSASENLQVVEGDASSVAARQASLPSPPPSASTLQQHATHSHAAALQGATHSDTTTPSAHLIFPASDVGQAQRDTLLGDGQPVFARESSLLRSEPPAPNHHIVSPHGHTTILTALHASNGGAGIAPTLHTTPDWGAAEQLAQHIERMVYERERNSLTVRLDPPELGTVEIRIQATGGEVQAWLSAERDLTRQMLQQTQQYLREHLESRGLQLTHFDVGTQSHFHHAPREQRTHSAPLAAHANTPTATDSLLYDGRWSVWV